MPDQPQPWGRLLVGRPEDAERSYALWARQAVDQEMMDRDEGHLASRTTLGAPTSVVGPGTYLGDATRKLILEPAPARGWRFDRLDLPDSLFIGVSVNSVWTTVRNIVLCSGSPHNYMRMVEHIIALKVGLGLDNVLIRLDSGDPPLFDRSSMDLVEAVENVGVVALPEPARYVRVKEPVTVLGPNGSFLTILPPDGDSRELSVDCALNFRSAIGKQRIRFIVTPRTFAYGALARTNTTLGRMLYCKTVGKVFADVRHLGYTTKNIQVAGRWRYFNKSRLVHKGKSLEAAWHRATLDLLAAVALIDRGRLAGRIISYKSGHALDVQMLRELYQHDLLTEM